MRLLATLVICVLTTFGSAQTSQTASTSPPVTRDPQALTLLSQCATAMGSALVSDVTATGTVSSVPTGAGPGGTIVSRTKGTQFRIDTTDSNGTRTYAVSNSQGWSLSGGTRMSASYMASAYARPDYVPALACVIDVARPAMNVTYVGLEQAQGRAVFHVKFNVSATQQYDTEPLISEFHVFLDQQTSTVVKVQYFVFAPNAIENRSTWENYYSDYRNVSGTLMPFHIENYLARQKVNDIVLSAILVNTGIPDSIFN
jgi:hypothetical protein